MIWQRWLGPEFARRGLYQKTPSGPMRAYFEQPFVSAKVLCGEAELLAVDLETTGLDPKKDRILSVGCVVVRALGIPLATARHRYLRVEEAIPEASAVIHRITDDTAAQGDDPREVLAWLLTQLRGRVLLAHHARIELGFLDRACREWFGAPLLTPYLDTLALAQRRFARRNQVIKPSDLRLFNLRRRYHLPASPAHNALSDALATAELFLALVGEHAGGERCRLGDLGMGV